MKLKLITLLIHRVALCLLFIVMSYSSKAQIIYPRYNIPSFSYSDPTFIDNIYIEYLIDQNLVDQTVSIMKKRYFPNAKDSTYLERVLSFGETGLLDKQLIFNINSINSILYLYDQNRQLKSEIYTNQFATYLKEVSYFKNKIIITEITISNLDTLHVVSNYLYDHKNRLSYFTSETDTWCQAKSFTYDSKTIIISNYNNCQKQELMHREYLFTLPNLLTYLSFFPSGFFQTCTVSLGNLGSSIFTITYSMISGKFIKYEFKYDNNGLLHSIETYEQLQISDLVTTSHRMKEVIYFDFKHQ